MRFAWTLFAVLMIGCGGEVIEGPPQVKYGHAECAGCGMIVSSERYASALVLPKGNEDRERIFDDINCMIEYETQHTLPERTRRYVHDAQSQQWLDAEAAAFIRNPDVHTPMGSGLQAFAQTTPAAKTYGQLLMDQKAPTTSESAMGR